MIFGPTGAGKTFVGWDAAATIASGPGSWFGRTVRGGAVVYVATEGGPFLRDRYRAWRRHHPDDDPALFVVPDAVQLMSPLDVDVLIGAVEPMVSAPVATFFFDTWSKVTPGADENSRQEMGQALANVDRICRHFDCGATLIHHTGGNTDKSELPRGTSSLLQAMDWAWLVTEKDGHRSIRCKKMRDGAPFQPIGFRLRPLAPSCVIEPTDPVEVLTNTDERAITALRGMIEPVSATWWLSASGLSSSTFYRLLPTWVDRGLVLKTANGYQLPILTALPTTPMGARVTTPKPPTPLRVGVGSNPTPGTSSEEEIERLAIVSEAPAR